MDCTSPPFRKFADGTVRDSAQRHIRVYPDVPQIMDHVQERGLETAIASRTDKPNWAREVLDLLDYRNRFGYEEIFPSSKIAHFTNLHRDTDIPFEEMLFFDDERRNIVEVGALGVKCVEVSNGMSWDLYQNGLSLFEV